MIEINKKTYCSTIQEALEKKADYPQLSKRLKAKVDMVYGTPSQKLCEDHYHLLDAVCKQL